MSSIGLFALATALLSGTASAQVLVRSEHPRILFRSGDITALRQKMNGPMLAQWNFFKKKIDEAYSTERLTTIAGNSENALYLGIAFTLGSVLTSDTAKQSEYRSKAIALTQVILSQGTTGDTDDRRNKLELLSLVYDWLYGFLSDSDKSSIRSRIAGLYNSLSVTETEQVSGWSHHTIKSRIFGMLAVYGESAGTLTRDQVFQNLDRDVAFYREYVRVYGWMASPDSPQDQGGGFFLGWSYGRRYLVEMLSVFKALQTATSDAAPIDFFDSERSWLRHVGYHLIYGLRPDQIYFSVGDAGKDHHPLAERDLLIMPLLAATYRNGHYQKFTQMITDWYMTPSKGAGEASDMSFLLLFYDPTLTAVSLDTLPPCRPFPRVGNYLLREGWNFRDNSNVGGVIPGDTVVLFRAMSWYHQNHEHKEFNNLEFFHKGPLGIDSGAYNTGGTNDYAGAHWQDYLTRTGAHNSIRVVDPAENFGTWRDDANVTHTRSNDGGQEFKQYTDSLGQTHQQAWNLDDLTGRSDFQVGRVPIYEDTNDYTYVVGQTGDNTPGGFSAYKRGKVLEFSRHVVFVKRGADWPNPLVILFDKVTSGNSSFKKIWDLHTVSQPTIQNKQVTVTNTMLMDVAYTNQKNQYGGKLYSQTLLPADAVLTSIGGPGREFWVDGTNTPISLDNSEMIQEPGAWRVEVSPAAARATDQFLHVLSPLDLEDTRSAPSSRLVDAGNMVGALVNSQLVLFSKDGTAQSTVGYTVSYLGNLNHLITGLQKNVSFQVVRGSTLIVSKSSTSNGTFFFTSLDGGTFTLTPSSSTPPPPDTTAPVISATAAASITSSGAVIGWTTNEPADSQVEYGLTSTYGQSTALDAALVTSHSKTLSGLTASTLYHFRVKSRDAAGNLAVSADLTFTTSSTTPVVLYLEAESGTETSPMVTGNDSLASAGSYIYVPNGSGYSTGRAVIPFSVPEAGSYAIWGRTIAPNTNDNSFFISVDTEVKDDVVDATDQISTIWDVAISTIWTWNRVNMRTSPEGAVADRLFNLSAGPHTLYVSGREDGTELDRVLITNNLSFVPVDNNGPVRTYLEAESGTLTAPMQAVNSSSASGGRYIVVPNGTGFANGGRAVWTFSIPRSGDYAIWGSIIAPTASDNSFYVSVDANVIDENFSDGVSTFWDMGSTTSIWSWRRVRTKTNLGDTYRVYTLSAGTHTLFINHREDGTQLDQILITDDLGTTFQP